MTDRIELPLAGTPFGASPSFLELVRREHPEAVPVGGGEAPFAIPHGTTVLGLKFSGGIVMAGDRRATAWLMRPTFTSVSPAMLTQSITGQRTAAAANRVVWPITQLDSTPPPEHPATYMRCVSM